MIKFIITIIDVVIAGITLNIVHKDKLKSGVVLEENEDKYIIKLSDPFKKLFLYCAMLFLGVDIIFNLLYLVDAVTIEYVIMFVIFYLLFFGVYYVTSRFKIEIDNDKIRLKNKEYTISEIDNVKVKKVDNPPYNVSESVIVYKNNKKMFSVESSDVNYDSFKNTLKKYGKL